MHLSKRVFNICHKLIIIYKTNIILIFFLKVFFCLHLSTNVNV